MTRRHLGTGIGLLAGALFVLALTCHGPAPALQVSRFQGAVHTRRPARTDATTRVPASAQPQRDHRHLATNPPRNDPRSSGSRVEIASADGDGQRSARPWAGRRERHPSPLLAAYHDANAPPSGVPLGRGRHA